MAQQIVNLPLTLDLIDTYGEVASPTVTRASTLSVIKGGVATEYGANVAAYCDQGLFNPAPVTNLLLHSNDFGTSPWSGTADAGTGAGKNETSIRGVSNDAWTLLDNSAVSIENVYQNISKLSTDTDQYIGVYILKKDLDETRFPEFRLVFTGGTTKYHIYQLNTKTGAGLFRLNSDSAATVTVTDLGDWWMLEIAVADGGSNTQLAYYVFPAYSTTIGVSDVTAMGSIIFNYAHIYKTSFSPGPVIVETGAASASIATQTVSWTMGSNLLDILSTAEGSATSQGTLGITWYPYYAEADGSGTTGIVSIANVAASILHTTHGSTLISTDGTNSPNVSLAWAANTQYKTFVRWDHDIDAGGDLQLSEIHGGSLANGTKSAYDGSFTLGTDLIIGHSNDFPFAIKTVQFWDEWQSDSWLENVYGADSSDGITDMGMGMGM